MNTLHLDLESVFAADTAPKPPFSLTVADDQLDVCDVLRWLPDRRLVVAGRYRDTVVVVKLFSAQRRSRLESQAELAALSRLSDRGIPAPQCLQFEQHEQGSALVMSSLSGRIADEYERQADAPRAAALCLQLVSFTGRMHRAGCWQSDAHLGNFIIDGGHSWLLDVASVSFRPAPLDERRQLQNLAVLLSQFRPRYLPPLSQILAAHAGGLSEPALTDALRKARQYRYRHFLAKTQRDCTAFVTLAAGQIKGYAVRDQSDCLQALLAHGLDKAMSQGTMLKDGNSSTVVRVSWAGRDWVIKRYNLKSSFHAFKRKFVRSRARNSWLAANWLQLVGIATPQPIAMFEERRLGMKGRAWFICEYLPSETVLDLGPERLRSQGVLWELVELLRLMQLLRFNHGDMKATNLLWADGELSVMDLDAMRLMVNRAAWRRGFAKDRRRLLQNWDGDSQLQQQLEQTLPPLI